MRKWNENNRKKEQKSKLHFTHLIHWNIGTWMRRTHIFPRDEWDFILNICIMCMANFVCHVNWWQIFSLHYRLMFCFPFECEKWRSMITYKWIQYTYICIYFWTLRERLSLHFPFLFYFDCYICGIISFSCSTDNQWLEILLLSIS